MRVSEALAKGSKVDVYHKKGISRLGRHQERMAYIFIAPAMLLFFIFVVYPIFKAVILSCTNYDIISRSEWVGLENYKRLLHDNLFFITLKNILYYVSMAVPTGIVISLGLAMILNRKKPGMKTFRAIYYIPMLTSGVAASVVWLWLLNPEYGLVNQLLRNIGIIGPTWLADSSTAMFAIVIVTLWQGVGGNMIIYLAGLQGIPGYLYESAVLDGANRWQSFWHITWPMLRPTTFFVSIILMIGAFQLFDQAYVMTEGGPANATKTVVYYIYETGFEELKMGYASAQAFVLFMIILAFSLVNIWINRESSMW